MGTDPGSPWWPDMSENASKRFQKLTGMTIRSDGSDSDRLVGAEYYWVPNLIPDDEETNARRDTMDMIEDALEVDNSDIRPEHVGQARLTQGGDLIPYYLVLRGNNCFVLEIPRTHKNLFPPQMPGDSEFPKDNRVVIGEYTINWQHPGRIKKTKVVPTKATPAKAAPSEALTEGRSKITKLAQSPGVVADSQTPLPPPLGKQTKPSIKFGKDDTDKKEEARSPKYGTGRVNDVTGEAKARRLYYANSMGDNTLEEGSVKTGELIEIKTEEKKKATPKKRKAPIKSEPTNETTPGVSTSKRAKTTAKNNLNENGDPPTPKKTPRKRSPPKAVPTMLKVGPPDGMTNEEWTRGRLGFLYTFQIAAETDRKDPRRYDPFRNIPPDVDILKYITNTQLNKPKVHIDFQRMMGTFAAVCNLYGFDIADHVSKLHATGIFGDLTMTLAKFMEKKDAGAESEGDKEEEEEEEGETPMDGDGEPKDQNADDDSDPEDSD